MEQMNSTAIKEVKVCVCVSFWMMDDVKHPPQLQLQGQNQNQGQNQGRRSGSDTTKAGYLPESAKDKKQQRSPEDRQGQPGTET